MRSYHRVLYVVHALMPLAAIVCIAFERAIEYCETRFSRFLDFITAPVAYLVRVSPVAAALAVMPRIKAIYFTIISLLKPEYRESYDTNGLSLTGLRS